MKKYIVPKTRFYLGQRVFVHPLEAGMPPFEATITGINFDPHRDCEPLFTIVEDDGCQSDGWTEDAMSLTENSS